MSKKAKLYWAIGIIIAILVAALLIWHTFFFGKQNANATAATVGDQTYTTTEVSYYYYSVANGFTQQAQAYQQMGMDMGYDPSLSPSEQTYNEEEGTTYADYFLEQALDQLQQVSILCREAEAAGYTLSAEGEQGRAVHLQCAEQCRLGGILSPHDLRPEHDQIPVQRTSDQVHPGR